MKFLTLVLMLSACSAYPKIDWPDGPLGAAAPALLPQSALVGPGAGTDPAGALVSNAAALRGWASSVAR